MDTATFAAMSETAAKVLRHNSQLRLAAVRIHQSVVGRRDQLRNLVAIQMPSRDGLRQVALWALEFGSPLAVIAKDGYVEISTEAVVDDYTVVAWDHIPEQTVTRLLSALHLASVESLATLEPSVLLAFDEPSEVAS